MSERYRVTSLDDVQPLPGPGTLRWLPIRHELGIGAFGTNAYVAAEAGDDVVEPHTEEGTGLAVSGWEARFRATAIREDDPERARELYEEALAGDQDGQWAHYDLACWQALYGDADEARRLLDRAVALGGEEVRAQAEKDPDLRGLREG